MVTNFTERLEKKADKGQIQTLLDDSALYYRRRNLKKALNTAQIALDFGLEEGADSKYLIKANILLAKIYTTNGQYQNEASFYQKALSCMDAAERMNESNPSVALEIEIWLVYNQVFQNLGELDKAEFYLNKAFKASGGQSNTAGIVLSLAGLSQLSLSKNDLDKALQYAQDGLTFLQNSSKENDPKLLVEIYHPLSKVYIKRKEYSQSLEHSQTLLMMSRASGDVEEELTALKNIAIVCGVKSNYKIGMQFFLEALDKSEAIGYRDYIVQILINIGTIYAHLYNYNEAINRYQSVLDEHEDILDAVSKVIVYNNLGNIYYSTDQFTIAREYFINAFKLSEECNYKEMIAHSLAQLSRTDIKLENFEQAERFARKAQKLLDNFGEINGKQINLLNLGSICYNKNDYKQTIQLTEDGIESAKKMKDDASEIRGYKLLASVYKAMGDFEKALEFQVKYSRIQEEFAKVQRNRQFLDLEIRHAIKEKQKEIEQLTKDNGYQALLLDKSDQIARQNQDLLRANEDLKQFAYVASHDLKEPLRMIGSYTQLLERKVSTMLDKDSNLYFHYIIDGVKRMNSLLDALLKYATVGNSQVDVEKINVNEVLEICKFNLKILIEESEAKLVAEKLPVVKASMSLLTQLFQNLISNAIKFRKPGKKPIIRIFTKPNKESHIIGVADNGIGIEPEHRDRIFQIFQRLHNRTQYDGTGIGLSICQKIAQRLGGRIWVESGVDGGATFFISIPR